ncbi:uncharacterized protein [Choristoneura fumiferana]|uniref:uncharacterized protein n=1 Tax=Choristoneura fumiferana TaxID=7141 RepID=UPI003D15E5B1
MLKATGSLLQGDALLIKSSIANASSKTPDELTPSLIENSKSSQNVESASDPSSKELANQQTKTKDKQKIDKDVKNASNIDGQRTDKSDCKLSEREDDDKTPTNEISISSINDTDNSILKESMESGKQVMLLADDFKMI